MLQFETMPPPDLADRQTLEKRQREARRQECFKESVCIVGFILFGLLAGIALRLFWHSFFL